jgi:hypothetical protein
MNETKHDQYVLDARKQTNSLVTASATPIPSACLFACLLGLKQPYALSLRPQIKLPFSHRRNSLEKLTYST